MVTGFVFDDELLDSLGEAEDGGDVLDVRYIVQSRLEDFFGDAPFGVDVNEATDTIDEPNFEEAVNHMKKLAGVMSSRPKVKKAENQTTPRSIHKRKTK